MPERHAHTLKLERLLRHDPFIRALARGLLGDTHDAEDLAQEVWVATLEHPPRHDHSLKAWFSTVTRHLSIRRSTSNRHRVRRERIAAVSESVRSTADIVEHETIRRAVVDAVFRLEEPGRTALLLRYYDDLPPRKIARRLGVPVDTIKNRIRRGLKYLRNELDHTCPGGRKAWLRALLPLSGASFGLSTASASVTSAPVLLGGSVLHTKWITVVAAGLLLAAVFQLALFMSERNNATSGGPSDLQGATTSEGDGEDVAAGRAEWTSWDEREALPSTPVLIEGRVTDDRDRALAGIRCLLMDRGGCDLSSTATDSSGHFALRTELGAGFRSLVLLGEHQVPMVRAVMLPEGRLADPEDDTGVRRADQGVIRLEPAGALDIRFASGDGYSLPPVELEVRNECDDLLPAALGLELNEPELAMLRGLDGALRYPPWLERPCILSSDRIRCRVPAGKVSVQARADGYPEVESDPIEIPRGGAAYLFLEFAAPQSIEGICLGRDHRPRAGVALMAWPLVEARYDESDLSPGECRTTRVQASMPVIKTSGPGGVSVQRPLSAVTDARGRFRFAPVLEGSRYRIARKVEGHPEADFLDETVEAGARDVRLFVDDDLELKVMVRLPGGAAPASGSGLARIRVVYDSGWIGSPCTVPLDRPDAVLPVPGGLVTECDHSRALKALVSVWWEPSWFGCGEVAFEKRTGGEGGVVELDEGVLHSLHLDGRHVTFLVLGWNPADSGLRDRIVPGSGEKWPRFLKSSVMEDSLVLGRGEDPGAYWIAAMQPGIATAFAWMDRFRGIRASIFDPAGEEDAESVFASSTVERITVRLDGVDGLGPDEQVRGTITARLPGRFGEARLGYWTFFIRGDGSRPLVYPERSLRYTPGPEGSVTLYRPAGLEYTVTVMREPAAYHEDVMPPGCEILFEEITETATVMEEEIEDSPFLERTEGTGAAQAVKGGDEGREDEPPARAQKPVVAVPCGPRLLLSRRFTLKDPVSFRVRVK